MKPPSPTPASRPKRLLFAALTALLTLAAIEAISFAYLSFLHGGWTGLAEVRALQAAGSAAGETALQPRDTPRAVDVTHGAYVIHPYLGYVLDSDFAVRQRLTDGGRDALDHGLTLFEPGLFYPASEERPVIAVTGGSVAFQLARDGRATLLTELARRFPAFEQAAVVNLALGGYKQPQQLISISYFMALGAHFDYVVNLDGFNEIALPPSENLPKGVFPFFPRSWFFRVQEASDPDQRLAEGRLAYLLERRRLAARRFEAPPLRFSPTAAVVWSLWDRRLDRLIAEQQLALLASTDGAGAAYAVTGPPWPRKPPALEYRELAAFWMRCSELMHRLVEASGGRYYHVLQPNQYVAGSKPMSAEERRKAIRPNHLYGQHVAGGYRYLSEHGHRLLERGVRFSDQTRVFSDVGEPLYADSCCHLNERGYELLARAIAGFIADDLQDG